MQLELHAFAGSGFTTPIADTNSSNDVFNFWVMRAHRQVLQLTGTSTGT
jgi:hypothetical protein